MAGLNIKKGDRVLVISGKDKGVTGEVISVDPANERVTVQGVNLVKKHRRESQTATGRKVEGGIINVEAPIHVSNVSLVVKVDGKDVPTRVGYRVTEDGHKVRIAKRTNEEL